MATATGTVGSTGAPRAQVTLVSNHVTTSTAPIDNSGIFDNTGAGPASGNMLAGQCFVALPGVNTLNVQITWVIDIT